MAWSCPISLWSTFPIPFSSVSYVPFLNCWLLIPTGPCIFVAIKDFLWGVESRLLSLCDDLGYQADLLGQMVPRVIIKTKNVICWLHELQPLLPRTSCRSHFQLHSLSRIPRKTTTQAIFAFLSSQSSSANIGHSPCDLYYSQLHAYFYTNLGNWKSLLSGTTFMAKNFDFDSNWLHIPYKILFCLVYRSTMLQFIGN